MVNIADCSPCFDACVTIDCEDLVEPGAIGKSAIWSHKEPAYGAGRKQSEATQECLTRSKEGRIGWLVFLKLPVLLCTADIPLPVL